MKHFAKPRAELSSISSVYCKDLGAVLQHLRQTSARGKNRLSFLMFSVRVLAALAEL